MNERADRYRVYLHGGVGQDLNEPAPEAREVRAASDTPFCLGIVGPFSGRRPVDEDDDPHARTRTPIRRVTPENVLTFTGLSPTVTRTGSGEEESGAPLRLFSMDDFHPDHLMEKEETLRSLWEARAAVEAGAEPDQERTESEPGTGLLEAVLGETGGPSHGDPAAQRDDPLKEDLDDFVRRAVDPHRVQEAPADRQTRLEDMDRQILEELQDILHDPAFQEVEALWRSVVFLLSRIQVSTGLRVYLIDVSEAELMADLLSSDDPAHWGFAHTVVNPVSENGEELRWGALVGAFQLGDDPLHVPLLQRIALLAESAEVPWISSAHVRLLGYSGQAHALPEAHEWTGQVDPLWEELRGKPEAQWIHLALPPFLARPPYGPEGSPVKRLPFQEEPGFPGHLLWGDPAILAGLALCRRFSQAGWNMDMEGRHEIQDLAMVTAPKGHLTCLQAQLSQSVCTEVRDRGLNPLVAPRNEPRVIMDGFRSISTLETGLEGWWKA